MVLSHHFLPYTYCGSTARRHVAGVAAQSQNAPLFCSLPCVQSNRPPKPRSLNVHGHIHAPTHICPVCAKPNGWWLLSPARAEKCAWSS